MPCNHLSFETAPPSKTRRTRDLKKTQISHVESDEESEDELDFHYVPPEVIQPNHVIESENREPLPTTNSDEYPNEALKQGPASLSAMESDQEQEINLPADENIPASMPSAESDQEGQEEQTYQLPRRERRPPRVFTYDNLGVPTYNVRQLNAILQTLQQHLPYVSAHGLSTWLPSVQQYCYPLPFVYGVH